MLWVVDEKNQEDYPLFAPYEILPTSSPELTTASVASESYTISFIIASMITVVIGLGLLVRFKKRKH
jgi:hypothetical protein